ncbi:hypothetical protein DL766_007007 [Monosporascus sp. MC13-8B]|uniref:Uncharacterized protein n=1 Tax=Monosporascus cannonballus TaxID=155416 RepID=A0ABY0H593_9PEZI|nr:hypothetical protein DL762_005301 [Monosporascus cannonballus]RYO85277.1 hypothetical protein DL763_007159 [Monosporascus cannonballus]RYP25552.1 hypothetical protein DL766_007007 [Monosporascus sp. MC13-8B]
MGAGLLTPYRRDYQTPADRLNDWPLLGIGESSDLVRWRRGVAWIRPHVNHGASEHGISGHTRKAWGWNWALHDHPAAPRIFRRTDIPTTKRELDIALGELIGQLTRIATLSAPRRTRKGMLWACKVAQDAERKTRKSRKRWRVVRPDVTSQQYKENSKT